MLPQVPNSSHGRDLLHAPLERLSCTHKLTLSGDYPSLSPSSFDAFLRLPPLSRITELHLHGLRLSQPLPLHGEPSAPSCIGSARLSTAASGVHQTKPPLPLISSPRSPPGYPGAHASAPEARGRGFQDQLPAVLHQKGEARAHHPDLAGDGGGRQRESCLSITRRWLSLSAGKGAL
jgi:hypothetical protein